MSRSGKELGSRVKMDCGLGIGMEWGLDWGIGNGKEPLEIGSWEWSWEFGSKGEKGCWGVGVLRLDFSDWLYLWAK